MKKPLSIIVLFLVVFNCYAQDSTEDWSFETIKVAVESKTIPLIINEKNEGILHALSEHQFTKIDEVLGLVDEIKQQGITLNNKNTDNNTPLHSKRSEC